MKRWMMAGVIGLLAAAAHAQPGGGGGSGSSGGFGGGSGGGFGGSGSSMPRMNGAGGDGARSGYGGQDGRSGISVDVRGEGTARVMTATDRNGNVLFDGPIGTEEQRKAVPPQVRVVLDRIEAHGGNAAQSAARAGGSFSGSYAWQDGNLQLQLRISGSQKMLKVTDLNGRVLYNGPANTPEERKAIPRDILARLEAGEARFKVPGEAARNASGGTSRVVVSVDDGNIKLEISRKGTDRWLTATGKDGTTVFDGPITTPEQRRALSPEVFALLEANVK